MTMRRAKSALLGLLAIGLSSIASGSAAETVAIEETFRLPSKILGEERTILISAPLRYAQGEERYPVLYLTDGDAHILHTRGTVDFLARNGVMPDLIIVGIANTDRTRDLTPTRWERPRPGGGTGQASGGGAGKLLDFIAQELIPFVEGRYRTAPYRILAGHSLGGLFALTAMTQRPELFNAFIAASPSLNWDDDLILRQTARFLEGRQELKRTLFVTMANEEAGDVSPTRFDRLRTTLGAAKASGFLWDSKLMEDEDHGTVVLLSHYLGLRKIFDGWRLSVDPKTRRFSGSLSDLTKYYAALRERFGIPDGPPEPVLNQIGYERLLAGNTEGALSFFRNAQQRYPKSPNVHDSLGEALERAGRTEEALSCYEKAVEIARKLGDARLRAYTANRDRLASSSAR
jgi:predicted alpha/beta superfamily hydrolase